MNSSMINFLNVASRMEEQEFDENQINKSENDYNDVNNIEKDTEKESKVNDRYFPRKNSKTMNIFNNKKTFNLKEETRKPGMMRTSSIDSLLPNEIFDQFKENKTSSEIKKQAAIDYHKKTLGEKIQSIFSLNKAEELMQEFPCWLMSSVLLQGNLYVTKNHLLYYANIPRKTNEVIKSGFLTRKANAAYSSVYWFVLRDYSLSYFENSLDVYCPYGMIDLKSVLSIQRSNSKPFGFKIITVNKKHSLQTDTEVSLKEWINAIKKAVFKAKHSDHIKIIIPINSIVDAELNPTFNFAETLRIKSVEANFAMDDHYFVFFEKGKEALKCCQEIVKEYYIKNPKSQNFKNIKGIPFDHGNNDSNFQDEQNNALRSLPLLTIDSQGHEDLDDALNSEDNKEEGLLSPKSILKFVPRQLRFGKNTKSASSSRRSSFSDFNPDDFMVFKEALSDTNHSDDEDENETKNKKHIEKKNESENEKIQEKGELKSQSSNEKLKKRHSKGSSLDFKFSNWLKLPNLTSTLKGNSISKSHSMDSNNKTNSDENLETALSSSPFDNYLSENNEQSASFFNFPNINTPTLETFLPSEETVLKEFALPNTEAVLCTSGCLLLRVVPRWGRLIVTQNFVCFYSRLVGMTIKVMIPISDLRLVQNQPGLRLLHHGLSIETISSQEIFLEFRSSKTRDKIIDILLEQMKQLSHEDSNANINNNANDITRIDDNEAEIGSIINQNNRWIQEYDVHSTNLPIIPKNPNRVNELLSNKPPCGPMHITCLTIGTRGDVQPFIALCKGLMKHGHTCRIATHAEYKDWVESHGIEFRVIAGDPGELIKLCVDNGMLSISFWKEGVSKFRGWIDELLESSWEACQNTDILLESPTAMAGIHIAEKLNIPFFGCFTMPWTRTRAFPHPFAIPEHQMGGSYNYMTYVLIEQVLWKGTSWQINNWRKKSLNLSSTSLEQLNQHRVPYLYSFSPAIAPPPFDWHDWIHCCGFFFLDDPNPGWTPSNELNDFLFNGDKPIYIGFGSITVPDPRETIQTIINAAVEANVKILLSEGWSSRMIKDKENFEPIQYPKNILRIDSVPHDWLFPKVAGVMHHGGAGTTAAGLRAGVPCIIKPFFGDQYFWAMQVERMGVGIYLKKLTLNKLVQALKDISEPRMVEKASLVGRQIRSENGVENAINFIYRDLEYSRSRLNKESEKTGESLINTSILSENEEGGSDLGWLLVGDKSNSVNNNESTKT
ncbi:UDP-Glycosyltransferase/glycogen phosphorylase [Neoconidiobolus thromboides FSU 785]|nr:UDP-Glycosyltransferase/glycogen phosphorylase [Neoconidiobolus thromboides FSU 785]